MVYSAKDVGITIDITGPDQTKEHNIHKHNIS